MQKENRFLSTYTSLINNYTRHSSLFCQFWFLIAFVLNPFILHIFSVIFTIGNCIEYKQLSKLMDFVVVNNNWTWK